MVKPDESENSKHIFTYVDGGTFNNEPIREAFRMASFLDSQYCEEPVDFDRKIIFVDPFVSDEAVSMFVPANSQYHAAKDHDDEPYRASSLGRLIPHVGNVLGMLMNEGRVVEGDKVFQTCDYFSHRDRIREVVITKLQSGDIDSAVAKELCEICKKMLKEDYENSKIPPGSLTLKDEMERVKRELDVDWSITLSENCDGEWSLEEFKLLICVYVDLLMDLAGKNKDAKIIAIAPFKNLDTIVNEKPAPDKVELLGAPVSGFKGFMSHAIRRRDFLAGRFCAYEFMKYENLINVDRTVAQPDIPDNMLFGQQYLDSDAGRDDAKKIKKEVNERKERMMWRLERLIRNASGVLSPQIIRFLISCFVEKMIENTLADQNFESYHFEIHILTEDDDKFVLDGDQWMDSVEAVKDGRRMDSEFPYDLITVAERVKEEQGAPWIWKGRHIKYNYITLTKPRVHLPLPEQTTVDTAIKNGAVGFLCRLPKQISLDEEKRPIAKIKWSLYYAEPLDAILSR